MHPQSCRRLQAGRLSGFLLATLLLVEIHLGAPKAIAAQAGHAAIAIDARQVTGRVSPLLFGHFIEHEHNTIQDGLWAELLHDRKFEQGDKNHDGVSDGWEPEARIADRYWQLVEGQGPNVRYFVDRQEYYGGGASQAIELYGSDSNQASVYQIGLQLARGRPYDFYVYLKSRGEGKAFVEFDKPGGPVYGRKEFTALSDRWWKYSAEFTVSEDTSAARIRIGFEGLGTFWMDSASLMPADNLHGMRRDVVEASGPCAYLSCASRAAALPTTTIGDWELVPAINAPPSGAPRGRMESERLWDRRVHGPSPRTGFRGSHHRELRFRDRRGGGRVGGIRERVG